MFRFFIAVCALVFVVGCVQETSSNPKPAKCKIAETIRQPDKAGRGTELHAADFQEPAGTLTLKEAISLTLMRNPDLKAFSYEVRAAEARQLQAGLWPNPDFEYELEDFGGTGFFSGTKNSEETIRLSQLIRLADKIRKTRHVFGFDSKLAEMDYTAKRLDVFTGLTESFITLLFVQEKRKLSQELIHLSEEVIKSVSKRVEAGKDVPLDLSKAKIGLANARIEHLEVIKFIDSTRKKIASFWDSLEPKFTDVAGNLEEVGEIESIDRLQSMLDDNPDIARWAIELQKRNAEKKLADAKAIPDLTIGGGWKRIDITEDHAYFINFAIPIPVFDSNQGGRLEARENIRKARQQKTAVYLSIRNELNRLHSELESLYDKLKIFREEVLPVAKDIFRASKTSYMQGKSDYLTLLDSQRTYFGSRNDYIDTLARYHIFEIQLQRVVGFEGHAAGE